MPSVNREKYREKIGLNYLKYKLNLERKEMGCNISESL